MNGPFVSITPSPDIMSLAGKLRDARYRLADGPEDKAPTRDLSLGDAIHLATAVVLREEFGVQDLAFHTFDEGKRRDGETAKRTVPMIGFDRWCRDLDDDEDVQRAKEVIKSKPEHPKCPLPRSPS